MSFFGLGQIFSTHHRSLVDEQHSRARILTALYAPGLASSFLALAINKFKPTWIDLQSGLSDSLIAALSLLSAILFGLSLTVLDKAIDMDVKPPEAGPDRDRTALRLQALSANTLSAAVVTAGATGVLVIGNLIPRAATLATAIGLGLLVTTGFNGALVIGRIFAETKRRTNRARTSGQSR